MKKTNQPIRIFDGKAQPHEPFWKFSNAAQASGETELQLYGVISEFSWLDDDITPRKFKDDLYAFGKGGPVKVRIDSPGGDPIAASVMRSIMTEYPGEITVQIDGVAASAAVGIALAGSTIRIMDSAYMMIHDPSVNIMLASLDIPVLERLGEALKSIKSGLVSMYSAHTGLPPEKIDSMMLEETWMDAKKAVELGFADEVIKGGRKQSAVNNLFKNLAFVNAISSYDNLPEALRLQIQQGADEPAAMSDTKTACMAALEYCIECLHQCEMCPNSNDALHQQCIAACWHAIACCAVCIHDESEDIASSQYAEDWQACVDACQACAAACRACGASCQVCAPACQVCADACQLCATVCSQEIAGENDGENDGTMPVTNRSNNASHQGQAASGEVKLPVDAAQARTKIHARQLLIANKRLSIQGVNIMNIREIMKQRANLIAEAGALASLADAEGRDFTDEERARYDAIMGVGDQPGEEKVLADKIMAIIADREKIKTAAELKFDSGSEAEKPAPGTAGTMKRAEFDALPPLVQSAFVRNRGKIID